MNRIFLLLCLTIVLSTGFFFLGWYMHQPTTTGMEYAPDFTSRTPFLALAYDACPPNVAVPEMYACIYKLSHSTLDEADILAKELIQTSPEKNTEQHAGFYESLHANIQSAQKTRDTYIDGVCDLDMMLIYGGTGATSEREACRYYYALKYLNTLKSLDVLTAPNEMNQISE
ncbi:MAG: hypothetical protein AAB660_01045 [Patescibacteria group bacterium]